ncbi:glycoside hydrolase [Dendryphion nanum]|uniref:AA9 family lytic polysaccharide monooxygenase n=1 Tax=Dendryphion nanum TaxID=256645 RepID=A0A9P9DXU1_9PLEO|nr:glycoside hydrolase [Dendryphion nanum]
MMRSVFVSLLAIQQVAGHALFQQLWVNGVDKKDTCVRMPKGNSPVSSVSSNDVRCNAGGAKGVAGKCEVPAGATITVEMHQQPGDRNCKNEAIGGAHYGPVLVYMTKVADAATADGSTGWFKVYENGWSAANKRVGDDDNWGVKDMNACCGKVDVKIPSDIQSGDYLVRAEVIALHTAGQSGGAQLYMSCYQVTVTGGGSASPATVKFPGAYKSSDPGIQINIHAAVSKYTVPGPPVVAGGTTKVPGQGASCAKAVIRGMNNVFDY